MNELKKYVIDEIKEHLQNYEGMKMYFCDIAYNIFECENYNGSYTCDKYKAKEWIAEYFEELGEIVEEIKFQIGPDYIPNVFDEPEKFQVVIIIETANYLLGTCETVSKYWNEEKTLTKNIINKIIKELEEKNKGYDFYE